MYRSIGYEFKNHLKLEVHRQIYGDGNEKKVMMLDGIKVCLAAWQHRMEVLETTYYCYASYTI